MTSQTPDERAQPPEVPQFEHTDLTPLERPAKAWKSEIPNIVVNPDGRIQLSTTAVDRLGTARDRLQAVRLYHDDSKRYLVIERAGVGEPNALRAFPVGRKENRWPQVHVTRAAQALRDLGVFERARYLLTPDPDRKWLVADLLAPLPVVPGEPLEQIRPLLEQWVRQRRPGEPVGRRDFWHDLQKLATDAGWQSRLLQRQLEGYLRAHRDELAKDLGLELVEADGSLRGVVVRQK